MGNCQRCGPIIVIGAVAMGGLLAISSQSCLAQITPDNTLGVERSAVTTNATVRGLPATLVEGGAIRGSNLFHSFLQFNVGEGQRVYFADPLGVINIFSRVTGNLPSSILGTLGVNGQANLFFLNPNGILFGPHARLDIAGSFVASTASHIQFPNGSRFSASDPQAPPLLTLNLTPGLQYGPSQRRATITAQGNLTVGKDLTLQADQLDVQGQLQAGRDLTLQAQDKVQIRESPTVSLLVKAGRDLTIQGNQGIDILALNSPQNPIQSGRNLSLVSDGVISGDAHFLSGGTFQVRSLSGQLANFISRYDPIISSTGNVDLAAGYTGASLLIESAGSVRIRGPVTINASDTAANFIGSDGVLRNEPGFIIRSGQPSLVYGGTNQNNSPAFTNGTVPTGITLDRPVRSQPNATGGIVKLTANNGGITFNSINASSVTGGNGGSIELTAKGDIANTGSFSDPILDPVALGSFSYSNTGNSGNGGNITLTSTAGNILLKDGGGARSYSYSYSHLGHGGNGGNISFTAANGTIASTNSPSNSSSYAPDGTAGMGGAISFAASGKITLSNSGLNSDSDSHWGNGGNAGSISFVVTNGNLTLSNSIPGSYSYAYAGNAGDGGAISFTINNGDLSLYNSSARSISESFLGTAKNGGNITIAATNGNIYLSYLELDSFSSSGVGKGGNGGNISLSATNGNISLLAFLGSGSFSGESSGKAGDISLAVTNGNLALVHSDIFAFSLARDKSVTGAENVFGTAGDGGAISLSVINGNLSITNMGFNADSLSNSTFGNSGNAGSISISVINGTLSLLDASFSINKVFFDATSHSNFGIAGNGGNISLFVPDGSILASPSFLNTFAISENNRVSGNGGKVTLTAQDTISGLDITTLASGGISGDVEVRGFGDLHFSNNRILTAQQVQVKRCIDCAPATVNLGDRGQAGNVLVTSTGNLIFDDTVIQGDTRSGQSAGSIAITSPGSITFNNSQIVSNTSSNGKAGSIGITAGQGITLNKGSQLSALTSSSGDAGNITLHSGQLTLNDGAEVSASTSGSGKAGDINIAAETVILSNGATLSTNTQAQSSALPLTSLIFSELGDSGQSLGTAQTVPFQPGTLVSAIQGNLNGPNDVDLYQIELRGDRTFSATVANSSQIYDTRLFLFNSDGTGIYFNDDVSSSNYRSALPANHPLTPNNPGTYYLAVTSYPRVPVSANGAIFNLLNFTAINPPTGPGGNLPLSNWVNNGSARGSYTINLTGLRTMPLTFPGGNGGNITITANTLTASSGAEISATTQGSGQAGNITLNINDRLELSGTGTGLYASTTAGSTGKGGNIFIDPHQVSITDGAQVAVSSEGKGDSGTLTIQADNLALDHNALLSATSTSGRGGDINLDIANILLLRHFSNISTTSGSTAQAGNGGNITISSKFIISAPFENSDISANAFNGSGGNVTINALRLFWISPLDRAQLESALHTNDPALLNPNRLPSSDITAISQNQPNLNGQIVLNTFNIDPSQGLVALPTDLVDRSTQISQTCSPQGKQGSSFVSTGRGGLPRSPYEPLREQAVLLPWATLDDEPNGRHEAEGRRQKAEGEESSSAVPIPNSQSSTPTTIIEAQGWVKDAQGRVFLVPQATAAAHNSALPLPTCPQN